MILAIILAAAMAGPPSHKLPPPTRLYGLPTGWIEHNDHYSGMPPGTFQSSTAPCKAGQIPISGGFYLDGEPGAFQTVTSSPGFDNGQGGWTVMVENVSKAPASITIYSYVRCQ